MPNQATPESTLATPSQHQKTAINKPVFLITSVIVLTLALFAIVAPTSTADVLNQVVNTVASKLGWFYIVTATIVVVFVFWVAASQIGHIRLGPDHSRPQFSTFSWASMLFAAGIGVDLLFFSVAEPISQFYVPPTGTAQTVEAAKNAVVLTLFHYGITGWAMYALMGMAFGYFAYRFNMPLSIRSALYPIIGKRVYGKAGDAVDIAAMLGTVFGVATSLGIGVTQLNYGLHILFGVPQNIGVQLALATIAVVVATISAVSGIDKGIKRLSELNVALALLLMIYITLTGQTAFLLNALIMNIGDYISSFPGLTLETYAFENPQEWMNGWTLFFWAWWIAWAPFVGLFLARVSRGRTIRQFVIGTLILPFSFIVMWVATFGNSALQLVLNGNDEFGQLALNQPEAAFYLLLEQYPAAPIVMVVATIVGFLLYITSADSAALVMSNFTAKITDSVQDGPKSSRIFWAFTTGILTLGMLLVNGIPALQAATVVMGLPFSFVMYLIMIGLYRAFQLETFRTASMTQTIAPIEPQSRTAQSVTQGEQEAVLSAQSEFRHDQIQHGPHQAEEMKRTWGQHLAWLMTYPNEEEINQYITEVGVPALQAAADTLQSKGIRTRLDISTIGNTNIMQADLVADLDPAEDFRYQLYPIRCKKPSYALRFNPEEDIYFRVEVFTATGSLGYDVAGHSIPQIREDVAKQYQRHLEFLHMQSHLKKSIRLTDSAGQNDWEEDFEDLQQGGFERRNETIVQRLVRMRKEAAQR